MIRIWTWTRMRRKVEFTSPTPPLKLAFRSRAQVRPLSLAGQVYFSDSLPRTEAKVLRDGSVGTYFEVIGFIRERNTRKQDENQLRS